MTVMDKKVFQIMATAFAAAIGNYLVGGRLDTASLPAGLSMVVLELIIVYMIFQKVIVIPYALGAAFWAVIISTCLQVFAAFVDWRRLDFFLSLGIYLIAFIASYYIFALWQVSGKVKILVAATTLCLGVVLYLVGNSILTDAIRTDLNRML